MKQNPLALAAVLLTGLVISATWCFRHVDPVAVWESGYPKGGSTGQILVKGRFRPETGYTLGATATIYYYEADGGSMRTATVNLNPDGSFPETAITEDLVSGTSYTVNVVVA